jgi:hypothetical protein
MLDRVPGGRHDIQEPELHQPADAARWRRLERLRRRRRIGQRQVDVLGKVFVWQPEHPAAGEVVERLRHAADVGAQIEAALP